MRLDEYQVEKVREMLFTFGIEDEKLSNDEIEEFVEKFSELYFTNISEIKPEKQDIVEVLCEQGFEGDEFWEHGKILEKRLKKKLRRENNED